MDTVTGHSAGIFFSFITSLLLRGDNETTGFKYNPFRAGVDVGYWASRKCLFSFEGLKRKTKKQLKLGTWTQCFEGQIPAIQYTKYPLPQPGHGACLNQ